MFTDGAAMLGYWLTGSCSSPSPPASITTSAITQAKIGRSMKKFGMTYYLGADLLLIGGEVTGRFGLHRNTRLDVLQALGDQAVAGLQAGGHQPAVAHGALGLQLTGLDLAFLVHHQGHPTA